jgi:hypothetical protein
MIQHHAQSINRSGITRHRYFAGSSNAQLHRRGTLGALNMSVTSSPARSVARLRQKL